jgi:hypothetical protein
MPAFVTTEQFSYGHVLEMWHRSYGSDDRILKETLPLPQHCLSCVCTTVLNTSYMRKILLSYMRDLNAHVGILTRSANMGMRRELQLLGE